MHDIVKLTSQAAACSTRSLPAVQMEANIDGTAAAIYKQTYEQGRKLTGND